jgi:hypothetical protein
MVVFRECDLSPREQDWGHREEGRGRSLGGCLKDGLKAFWRSGMEADLTESKVWLRGSRGWKVLPEKKLGMNQSMKLTEPDVGTLINSLVTGNNLSFAADNIVGWLPRPLGNFLQNTGGF